MKTFSTMTLVMALGLLWLWPAWADKPLKIAHLDLQKAILETQEGKKAKTELKKYVDDKQTELDKEEAKVKAKAEDYEKQQGVMDPSLRLQREAELQKDFAGYQKLYLQLQGDLEEKESTAFQPIYAKMMEIIQSIAEKDEFDYVLEKRASGLLYAPSKFDLTNDAIRAYDNKK